MHFHMSLLDQDQNNIFSSQHAELSVDLLNVISGVTPQNPILPSWGVWVFWIYTLTLWYVPYRYYTDKNKEVSKPTTF